MDRSIYLREKLNTIEPTRKSIAELLEAMADTAYQGRRLEKPIE